MTSSDPVAEFKAQPALQPGTPGWWKVWGAQPRHILAGDIVLTKTGGEVETLYIDDTFEAKAAPLRVGLVAEGERFTLGALCPVIIARRGTHNTLAE